jgi:hypothetical protein
LEYFVDPVLGYLVVELIQLMTDAKQLVFFVLMHHCRVVSKNHPASSISSIFLSSMSSHHYPHPSHPHHFPDFPLCFGEPLGN